MALQSQLEQVERFYDAFKRYYLPCLGCSFVIWLLVTPIFKDGHLDSAKILFCIFFAVINAFVLAIAVSFNNIRSRLSLKFTLGQNEFIERVDKILCKLGWKLCSRDDIRSTYSWRFHKLVFSCEAEKVEIVGPKGSLTLIEIEIRKEFPN